MYPDEREDHDIDSFHVFRRQGVWFCLYDIMHVDQPGQGTKEVYLATSRDEVNWQRTWDRKPFFDRGPAGSWDAGCVTPPYHDPIEICDNLYFYYEGGSIGAQTNADSAHGAIGMYRLRRDRFIGLTAGQHHGYLLTRQFTWRGDRLVLNIKTEFEEYIQPDIRLEVVEYPEVMDHPRTELENRLPGFTFEDCDPIFGNCLEYVVKFNGNPDMSALESKAVYLRFRIHRGTLYSFRVVRTESS